MTIVTSIIAFAVLFGIAAALRQRRGCGHDCGACASVCRIDGQEHT
jgi:hypothetical protein